MAETVDQQRIRQLEAEVAELKAKTKPQPPAAARVAEDGVRVTYSRKCSIELPTMEQYRRLISIVARSGVVPNFDGKTIDPAFLAGFVGSFERITSLRRSDGLNHKRPARDWAAEAYHWLKERGDTCDPTNGSFYAAVIAAGDVHYSLPQLSLGIPALVGLTYDQDDRPASAAAWRGVLERGQPRPPTNPVPVGRKLPTPTVRYIDGR
jgi:hypothetical protein